MIRKLLFVIAAISLAAITTLGKSPKSATTTRGQSAFALSQSKHDLDGLKGKLKEEPLKKEARRPTPKPKSEADRLQGRLKQEATIPTPTLKPTPKPRPDREEIIERLKQEGAKKRVVIQPKPTPTPKRS